MVTLPQVPTGQTKHVVALLEFWYEPIAHGRHPLLPLPGAYDPAGQPEQPVEAGEDWKLPGAQRAHTLAPWVVEYVPAPHVEQIVTPEPLV